MSGPIQTLQSHTVAASLVKAQALLRRIDRFGVATVSKEDGITPAKLYRLLERRREGLPLYDRRLLNPGMASSIDDKRKGWALAYMAAHQGVKTSVVCRELNKVAVREEWPLTDYQALNRALKAIPADVRELLAQGSKAMFEKASVVGKREQTRPLELVQLDASDLPVYTIHPASGELIRPVITGIIDSYSRAILHVELHLAPPNAIQTVAALTKACLPKGDDLHPMFGLPEVLQTDNAAEYIGDVMAGVATRAGFILDQVPINSPSANGKIERFFGTFKTQFASRLAGYARQSHGMKKAKKEGVIPFAVLQNLVNRYLVEYHSSVHSELGVTPWEAWHEKLDEAKGYFVPAPEIRKNLRVDVSCDVSREGVTVLGSNYSGPALNGLVGDRIWVLTSAEGGDRSIDAYHRRKFIGRLRPRALVCDAINTSRTARKTTLTAFRSKMKKALKETPPVGEVETVIPREERSRIAKEKKSSRKRGPIKTRKLEDEIKS